MSSQSDLEASRSQERLQRLVEQILAENSDLRHRLGQMQDALDAQSRITSIHSGMNTLRSNSFRDPENRTSRSTDAHRNTMIAKRAQSRLLSATFESILEKSRVYKRNRDGECDMSFKHSDLRSHAWSYLTGYSLADISVLSVISMPITQRDITNSTYYSFGVVESHVDDTARSGRIDVDDSKRADEKPLKRPVFSLFPLISPAERSNDLQAHTDSSPDRSAQFSGTNSDVATFLQPVPKFSKGTRGYFTDHRDGYAPCKGCGYVSEDQ